MRAIAQPPSVMDRRNGEHWAGRLYMRRISPYVTYALLRTGLSANAVTFLMALVGVAGAAAFVRTTIPFAIIGSVLVQLYLLLDCSDGEMARVTNTTGATGIFLDRLGHFVVEAALIVAAGVGSLSAGARLHCVLGFCPLKGDTRWLLMSLIAALVHVLAKVQTDVVEVARAKAGLAPLADTAESSAPRGAMGIVRRAADLIPINRFLLAVEASILLLAASIADDIRGDLAMTHALIVLFFVAAIYEFVGHLVGILASSRLRS